MKLSGITLLSFLATQISAQKVIRPLPPSPIDQSSCTCNSDYDCQKPVCTFDAYAKVGTCGSKPLQPISPIRQSTTFTVTGGTGATSCTCQTDYDCQKPICKIDPYTKVGTCVGTSGPTPTRVPTRPPTKFPTLKPAANNCCVNPRPVPTECEVDILIKMLDIAISSDHKLAAQWLRLAFHDAGTFDVATDEGGANGCLMTDLSFRAQPENGFLDIPINTLAVIKSTWEAHPDTCLAVSAADIIQFAGLFASLRQVPPAGIDPTKRSTLMQFEWGRPDEINCQVHWVDNLPGFRVTPGGLTGNIPLRCLNAGGEIKTKMMERNGFTAEEATALIGAHTIGLTRNSFHVSNPWVTNGADNATPSGPVFDNAFHDFLINTIVANTAPAFSSNISPFDTVFPDWFLDNTDDLSHLDTDIALAFPSQNLAVHPHFHTFTMAFAADNALFLKTFFLSLDKMSKLGVHELLTPATPCTPCDGNGEIGDVSVVVKLVSDLGAAQAEGEQQLLLRKESEELATLHETDTVPLKESEIVKTDLAVKELNTIVSADTMVLTRDGLSP